MPISVSMTANVAVITLDNPPVNAISSWVPAAFIDTLRAQDDNPAVVAIVLRGAGRCFSAGADIAEFNESRTGDPHLRDLLDAIDAVRKPVVVAIHGLAYGGGLEIALTGHWRLCVPGARFALPEIHLGLIPGAGGTQRLPRLVGPEKALAMILDGRPIDAVAAKAAGLIDEIVAGDLTEAAVAFARTATVRRVRDMPAAGAPSAMEEARGQIRRRPLRREAIEAAIECVALAATAPFDVGCAREYALFDALLHTAASRALRYAFAAERAVGRVPGVPTVPDAVERVAIIGGGTMGTGIALAFLNADLPVTLIEARADARERCLASVRGTLASAATRGRITQADADARIARFAVMDDLAAAATADIVIEAVFEEMAVKREVFAALDRIAKPGAILASNTSTLDIDAIAAVTSRPDHVAGTHFFSPANVMKLLEIVRGAATAPAVTGGLLALAKRIGKVGVVAGVCDGFIGNRMFEEYLRQAYWLLEEGALPDQVDTALERWGMALGPLRVMDLAGNDIGWSIRKRRAASHPEAPYSRIPDLVCELGRFGQKTHAGWYLYPDGRRAQPDPRIDTLIVSESRAQGIERREITDAEIVERCVLALVNEGAKLLADGIAARPLDIDQVYIHGYGFPAERGGPMFYADELGLPAVLGRIEALATGRNGWAWQPAPLLLDLVARGADFASLNKAPSLDKAGSLKAGSLNKV